MLTIPRWLHIAVFSAFGALGVAAWSSTASAADPAKIVGPGACDECHKTEVKIWQNTHHFASFREMPRKQEATDIATKMGVERIRTEGLCANCHFTLQAKDGKEEPIAGVSCELCHGAALNWNKPHGNFSGKKKETESPAERDQRWKDAEAAGMIRPHDMYSWAKNCYSCHIVPQEKLVNVGGHVAGSPFELVAWSQGEIRHNTWYTDGKSNPEAPPATKRKMYVVGAAVELEELLRAVGKATQKDKYAVTMAQRAQAAAQRLNAVAAALKLPELDEMVAAMKEAKLSLNNDAQLTAIADKIGGATQRFVKQYDGSTLGGVNSMLPAASQYKDGEPKQ